MTAPSGGLLLAALLVVCCRAGALTEATALVPALFVFGDSLADAGNNNHLRTLAKANHPPYGRDFPPTHNATGRFVNGYTAIDLLCFKLGLPLLPIHSDPATTGARTLQGVNFASAASGITSYAGLNFGKVFSLDEQIQQFAGIKQDIAATIGATASEQLIAKSLYYIVTGSNDWLNTYYFLASPLPRIYTVTQYRNMLVAKLLKQIQELYGLGSRRLIVSGLGPFGCAPSQLRTYKSQNGTCIAWLNKIAEDFNYQLRTELFALQETLPGAHFGFHDSYAALLLVRNNPSPYGFTIIDQACCGIGKYGGFLNCFQGFPACDDDGPYLFWDAYHPTSKYDQIYVNLLWANGPPYSYPFSGEELAGLVRSGHF